MKDKAENAQKIDDFNKSQQTTQQTELSDEEKIKLKAEEDNQEEKDKEEDNQENDSQKKDKEEQDNQEENKTAGIDELKKQLSDLQQNINTRIDPLVAKISSFPTPGKIMSLLIFIGFMLFLVMPVDSQGHTRAYLFFNTLLLRTHMKYREDTPIGGSNSSIVGGGSSGDFGTTTTNGIGTGQQIDFSQLDIFNG